MQRAHCFQAPGSDGGPCPHHMAKGQGRVRRAGHSSSGEVKARQVRAPQPGTAPRPSPTTAHRTCVLSSQEHRRILRVLRVYPWALRKLPALPIPLPHQNQPTTSAAGSTVLRVQCVLPESQDGGGGLQIPRLSGKGEFYHSEEERKKPNSLNYGTSKNAPQIPVGDFRAGEIRHTCNSFPH